MKSIKRAFVFLIAVTMISSCQKEFDYSMLPPDQTTGTPSQTQLYKVKTYTEDYTASSGHSVITYNLSYDSKDRIKSMVSASNEGDRFVYNYDSANTFTIDIYNSNKISIHSVYFLNSFSFVDSSLQYNDTPDTTTEKFFYNNQKQLVKRDMFNYKSEAGSVLEESHSFSYDSNGNELKDSSNDNVISYDYYTDLSYTLSFIQPYTTVNKNLVKTTTSIESGETHVLNHTYEFDDLKRLIREKVVANSGEVVIRSYIYQ